jgi:hypothetical protein
MRRIVSSLLFIEYSELTGVTASSAFLFPAPVSAIRENETPTADDPAWGLNSELIQFNAGSV